LILLQLVQRVRPRSQSIQDIDFDVSQSEPGRPAMVEGCVVRNPVQPRAELRLASKLVEFAMNAQKHILSNFFGVQVGVRSENGHNKPKDAILISPDKCPEGISITVPTPPDEFKIVHSW
jgi:hypothetical protein